MQEIIFNNNKALAKSLVITDDLRYWARISAELVHYTDDFISKAYFGELAIFNAYNQVEVYSQAHLQRYDHEPECLWIEFTSQSPPEIMSIDEYTIRGVIQ